MIKRHRKTNLCEQTTNWAIVEKTYHMRYSKL